MLKKIIFRQSQIESTSSDNQQNGNGGDEGGESNHGYRAILPTAVSVIIKECAGNKQKEQRERNVNDPFSLRCLALFLAALPKRKLTSS